MRFVLHVKLFEKSYISTNVFVRKSVVRMLSQIKGIILELILEVSRVECQLD